MLSPTSALRASSTPEAGASISSVALSASISAMTSPLFTVSPTSTSQLSRVPSIVAVIAWAIR